MKEKELDNLLKNDLKKLEEKDNGIVTSFVETVTDKVFFRIFSFLLFTLALLITMLVLLRL